VKSPLQDARSFRDKSYGVRLRHLKCVLRCRYLEITYYPYTTWCTCNIADPIKFVLVLYFCKRRIGQHVYGFRKRLPTDVGLIVIAEDLEAALGT
jgi:hypothetical protein